MKNLLFVLLAILCFSNGHTQVTKALEPSWVENVKYSKSNLETNEVDSGVHMLLYDTQVNIPEQMLYNRITTQITENVGIQEASNITAVYDPSYQTLKFHKINIIRDGEIIDKLDVNNIQVMRRELNADNYLYDGSLSAVMNVSDVRTNDIVDYAYSITGFNPIHKNVFSTLVYLNNSVSIGKVNFTLISNNELQYKSFNTSLEPVISNQGDKHIYNWSSTNTKIMEFEENTPSWKLIFESVLVSEYNSWKDVVDWGLDVYKINDPIDPKLQTKIDEINTNNKTNGDKIKATLNFVQNEIRYLGLESGIGSYKPFSPNQVFNQRFGDCKDKSLLMTTMLNKMDIEAYPMLVNTELKQTIKDLLPSPKFFDHCVVKVVNNSVDHWYDPTITNQGGYYDSTHFPNYGFGLVLKAGNDSFDEIKPYSENKIETVEEYDIQEIGKGATLKITTTYHEGEADIIRNYIKNNSINSIQKEYEKFYSNYYYNVSSISPPEIEDQLDLNILKIRESYKLDSIWQPMLEKKDYIAANFSANSLLNMLYIPTKDKRDSELSIIYPIIREHKTKIKLPIDWGIENEKLYVNASAFYYEWKVNYNRPKKEIDIYHYLKTLKDHVGKEEYKKYIEDVKKVDQTSGYYLYIPKNASISNNAIGPNIIKDGIVTVFKFLVYLGVLIALVLFLFWYFNRRKSN